MSVKSRSMDGAVVAALTEGRVEGNLFYLGPSLLDRKVYMKVADALNSIGGKWARKARAFTFPGDPSEYIERLIVTGSYEPFDLNGFFETPRDLAIFLCEKAELTGYDDVLEPSAGRGALADVIAEVMESKRSPNMVGKKPKERIVLVEQDERHIPYLTEKGYPTIHQRDFLDVEPPAEGKRFDRVVMNPPFSGKQDIQHVLHAWKFVRDYGRLVAVMSASVSHRQDKLTKQFRAWVNAQTGKVETFENDPDAFVVSGTKVRTITISMKKESGNVRGRRTYYAEEWGGYSYTPTTAAPKQPTAVTTAATSASTATA